MRHCLLVLFVLSTRVLAAPSEGAVRSCLSATSLGGASLTSIETREIYLEDNYRPGYQAEYLLFRGLVIGVARSLRGDALVYRGLLHPLRGATALPQTRTRAGQTIQVALANWSLIRENGKQYLCVSDQFDGIGRSGSFQKARYGYLLETAKKGRLFFFDGVVD